jgi:hypothetical protein
MSAGRNYLAAAFGQVVVVDNRSAKLSNQPLGGMPQDFTDMIKGDIGKWAPIVKALGLTAG